MPNNDFLAFASTDTGTNLLAQADYLADAQRLIGNQPGVARSKLMNKVLRQTSLMTAAIASLAANKQSADVVDTLSASALATILENMIKAVSGQGDEKNSVRVATTANIASLTGLLTVDGVVLIAGDRVLVKDQTTGSQNGIYTAAAGAWSRAADADVDAEVTGGMLVPVEEGTTNADTLWMMTNDGTVTVGTTALTFQWAGGLNAPTQVQSDNSRKIATTAFVQTLIALCGQLAIAQTWTKAQRGAILDLVDGATITPDFSASNNFRVQLGGNRTLGNPTNIAAGQSGVIDVLQDATGSRTLALAWMWSPPGGTAPTMSTAALTRDQIAYYVGAYGSANVTISIATPGVVTWNGHGFKGGEKIVFSTTGALPTGLTAGTVYYIKPVDANTFQLSATLGGAAIATSGAQSGVHTATVASITCNHLKGVA